MGDRTNNIISKTFDYDLPDDYLYQTNDKKLVGTYTYNGPDKLWMFVYNDTGHPVNGLYYTEMEDGDLVPIPEGQTKVLVDVEKDPIIASLLVNPGYQGEFIDEILPDGSVYPKLNPPIPDHTYEFMELTYDREKHEWVKPYPWKKPHMDWETLKRARDMMLRESDLLIRNNILTEEEMAAIEEYRQKLRDLPTTFDGVDPWKVPFPETPKIGGGA